MFKSVGILVVGLMIVPCLQLRAEDDAEPQQPPAIGGIQIFGDANGRFEFRNGGFRGNAVQISKTVANGVTTIKAVENGVETQITEDPNAGITVTTSNTYDSSNADELKDKNPAIFEYLKKAPQGMGEVTYAFKVDVRESYSAENADELKKRHPEAHDLYEKYSQGGVGNAIRIQVAPGFRGRAIPNRFPLPQFDIDDRLKDFEQRMEEFQERFQRQLEEARQRIETQPRDGGVEEDQPGIAT